MRKFSRNRLPAPSLTLTEAIQANFGITQQQLADLLGVSRSTLAMDGRDGATPGSRRQLPLAAELRLLQLQQLLPTPFGPAPLPAPLPAAPMSADDRETLELRLMKIELEQYPLRQQLARLDVHLAQARLRVHALPALRNAWAADARAQRWLDNLEAGANSTIRHEEATPQLLALKLRVLAFEAEQIRALLG